jgi:TonB family protein
MRKTTSLLVPQLFAVMLALSAGVCGNYASAQDENRKMTLVLEFIGSGCDGGIALVKNAPFSGEMVCESIKTTAGGNRIVNRTTILIYRDRAGRVRQEGSVKMRDADSGENKEHKMIQIVDPYGSQNFTLSPQNRRAIKFDSGIAAMIFYGMTSREAGKNEPLGSRVIEGVATEGIRATYIRPAGGNEKPIQVITERWRSKELQLDVLVKSSDPVSGESTRQLTNINRGEPGAAIFEIPPDYTVQDFMSVAKKIAGGPSNANLQEDKKGMAILDSGNRAAGGTAQPMTAELRPTIVYREKAKYTEEARDKGVAGTVVLNVVFTADGKITNVRVVKGLPDGLTEKAIEAALKIRFNPAVKDGAPVSVSGNLEFTFIPDK